MSVSYTVNDGRNLRDYRGKSTDVKPVEGVPNMSTFWEVDTGKVYYFDGDLKKMGRSRLTEGLHGYCNSPNGKKVR